MTQVGKEDEKLDTTTMKAALDKNLEELRNSGQVFVGINGRQFEALYSCVTKEAKEASDAREQASATALHSMKEKMDQYSKETSTKVSHILKKVEKVDKDLAATKCEILEGEMLQIDFIDEMRDDIGELKNEVRVLHSDLRVDRKETSNLKHEMWAVKDDVKDVPGNVLDMEDEICEVRDEMYEVRDKLKDLERIGEELVDVKTALKGQKDELKDVETALKSLKDELRDVTNELKSMKDLATKDIKTRAAKVEQNEMVPGAQEVMLYELQKVTDEASCVKHDLRDIGVDVTDELGMGVGGRLRDVRHELRNIRHEMRSAAKDEPREPTDPNSDFLKEFNDTVRAAQRDYVENVRPTLDDTFREVTTDEQINNTKRKRDSRDPTLKQDKKLRKESVGDERGTASASSTSVHPIFPCSSDFEMSASSCASTDSSDSSYSYFSNPDSSDHSYLLDSYSSGFFSSSDSDAS